MSSRQVFIWWSGWGAVGALILCTPILLFYLAVSSTARYYTHRLFSPTISQTLTSGSPIPGATWIESIARAVVAPTSYATSAEWAARNEEMLRLRRHMRGCVLGWVVSGFLSFAFGCGWLAVGIQRLKRL